MPLQNPFDDTYINLLSDNIADDEITLTKTEATVGGVRRVTLSYAAHNANIDGNWYRINAGSVLLNSADVVNPTMYYIYTTLVSGAPVVQLSNSNPEDNPALEYKYSWIAIVRMKSVGGTATIYYWRTAYTCNKLFLHYIGEYDYYTRPTWIKGGGLTINATTGVVNMEELFYRRMRFDRTQDDITAGAMLYEDESAAVANLELITTYSDGSAITAGKYHKILFGVVVGKNQTSPFMVIRQGKPDTEYTSLDEARIDAENVAGTSFPFTYRGGIFHIAYIIMKMGDASDLETIDLRPTGAGGGGGGGAPIADHDALVNLGTTSHDKYLLVDGTRATTGDFTVGGNIAVTGTVDTVDIAAHAANANAHHNAITLNAAADTILGLSTQQITLDTQAANTVLCGPASGAAATPTFRILTGTDLSRAYATIYVADGATTQALAAATPTKLTLFAANSVSLNATPDHTNDQITIVNSGDYTISGNFSGKSSVNNTVFQFHAAINGANTYLGAHKKIATAGDEGCCSFCGDISLVAGQVITVNVVADKNTNFTLIDGQLKVTRSA